MMSYLLLLKVMGSGVSVLPTGHGARKDDWAGL